MSEDLIFNLSLFLFIIVSSSIIVYILLDIKNALKSNNIGNFEQKVVYEMDKGLTQSISALQKSFDGIKDFKITIPDINIPEIKVPTTNVTLTTLLKHPEGVMSASERFSTKRINADGPFDFYEITDKLLKVVYVVAQTNDGSFVAVHPVHSI